VVEDEKNTREGIRKFLEGLNYDVMTAANAEEGIQSLEKEKPDLVLTDIRMPGTDGMKLLEKIVAAHPEIIVILLTAYGTVKNAVKAMKIGAADYLTKPFNLDEVKIVVASILERGKLKHEVEYLRKISSDLTDQEVIGKTDKVHKLKEKCEKFAAAGVPMVLITGESGTGKEIFARYIHRRMHPVDSAAFAPFVGINCAALPEQLIESELFGHERGAFTDAKAEKKGIFEMAHGGSILLDEIGEMRLDLQAKLLRVLEDRKVRRIGGRQDIPIDTTVFATTNRNLEEAVEKGEFRVDLYYRLNGFSLHLPPLRERKGVFPFFVRHFLKDYSERYKKNGMKDFSPEAEDLLVSYRWPGNIRELRNVIERIVVLENGEIVQPEHLPAEILHLKEKAGAIPSPGLTIPDSGLSLEEVEKSLIIQALGKAGNNKTLAAKLLGITYDSLRYQVKKLGLE